MPVSFTVLASGSSGNASILEVDSTRVLIDCGIGPRQLAARLKTIGLTFPDISAAVLTHTHGDHWRDTTLKHFGKFRIPCHVHPAHERTLLSEAASVQGLCDGGLVRRYQEAASFEVGPGLVCWPIPLRHDGGPTFGFRFVARRSEDGTQISAAYMTDLGSWTPELVQIAANVDLLALEFNHDVEMELASGRSSHLIERVLGKNGHLSNDQAAEFLREVLRISQPGRLQHVVQLHLSRDCNDPELAVAAARAVLQEAASAAAIWTAHQDVPSPRLHLSARTECAANPISPIAAATNTLIASPVRKSKYSTLQTLLPGF